MFVPVCRRRISKLDSVFKLIQFENPLNYATFIANKWIIERSIWPFSSAFGFYYISIGQMDKWQISSISRED